MTIYIVDYEGYFKEAFTNLEAARKYVNDTYGSAVGLFNIYPYVVKN